MQNIKGKHNTAKVFTDTLDSATRDQIELLLNQEFVADSQIRVMPDTHKGTGCVIGMTMTIEDKVVPNIVGVDIGCGMYVSMLGKVDVDLPNLDRFITNKIPHGKANNRESQINYDSEIKRLHCYKDLSKKSQDFNLAIGSLGGGNHFIELNMDNDGNVFLVIHSGSRNMGLQIANYYQKKAIKYHRNQGNDYVETRKDLITLYKKQGKQSELQNALSQLEKSYSNSGESIPDALCYLEGAMTTDYFHDLKIAQKYAELNREIMSRNILNFLGITPEFSFHTVHNYIDLENKILRKGAVSAEDNQLLIIPINMRDGSILAYGKGNADWNYSAPHGAGRLMSRTTAKEKISLTEFKETMTGVYSTSVRESTIDESPFAYKSMDDIINNIGDTVEIHKIIRPIYNFKA
jgi:RNA-splicing ligase RtcB